MSVSDVLDKLLIDIQNIDIQNGFGFSSYGIRGKPGSETPESPETSVTPNNELPNNEFRYSNIFDEMTSELERIDNASRLERIDNAYKSIEGFEKSKDLENDAENVGTMIARMKWYKVYRSKYGNIKIFGHFWMILSDIIKIQAMLINQRQPKEINVFIEEVFIKGYFVLADDCWGKRSFQEFRTAHLKLGINVYDKIVGSEIFIDMCKEIAAIVSFINIMTSIYVNNNEVNPRTKTFFEQIPEGADLTSIMNQCRELSNNNDDILEMENERNKMNQCRELSNNKDIIEMEMTHYLKSLKRRLAAVAEMNNIDVENKSEYLKALEKSYNWNAVYENDINSTNSFNNTNANDSVNITRSIDGASQPIKRRNETKGIKD
ncbi:25084_t:CDS:2 [Dentiscutata erythropus]|uniref:25084_t:CDS:1 n=1 Tax=Dentiscutata erythropus TaxID=1348616 RepID=A0A9N9A3N2_9GLOM|nr:25084_t:CDS:2 [Dentiscutata erythropus]